MSNYITGSNSKAWIRKEDSYGQGFESTTGQTLINMTGESMSVAYNKLDEATLIASKTAPAQDLGSVAVSGGVDTILKPAFADLAFELALGKATTISSTVEVDGAIFNQKEYILQDVAEDIPSLAMRMTKGTWMYEYNGLTISSLTLECPAQDFVRANFDFRGREEISSTVAATAPAAPDQGSYKCTKAKLYIGPVDADQVEDFEAFDWNSCPADTVTDVENTTVTFDNGLEDTPATYCSGIYANRPAHGQRTVTLQCNVPYSEDFQEFRRDYYANEDPDRLGLMLAFCTKESYSIEGAPDVKYPKEQVFVIFDNVSISDATANISGQGLIDSSFTGTALSVGTAEPVRVIVRHYDHLAD